MNLIRFICIFSILIDTQDPLCWSFYILSGFHSCLKPTYWGFSILSVDLLIDMMHIILVLRFNHVRGPLGNYINRCLSDATRDEWLQPSTLIQSHRKELTKIEASTIRNPQTPLTLKSGFTTPNPAFSAVIAAVPTGWSSGLTEIGVNLVVGWFSIELKRFHNVVWPRRPGKKTARNLKCFSHGVSVKLGTEIIGIDDGMSEWVRWAQGKITAFERWRWVIKN